MTTIEQHAWAAGFLDGEGCIHIQAGGRQFCLRVIMVQKDSRPLDKMQSIFGGNRTMVTRKDRKYPYHRLTLSGSGAAFALRSMLPYLTLKRKAAEIALEFQQHLESFTDVERSAGLPDWSMKLRKELSDKVKWENTGRWAAATTKSEGRPEMDVSDSLDCTDDKGAEVAEMTTRLQ